MSPCKHRRSALLHLLPEIPPVPSFRALLGVWEDKAVSTQSRWRGGLLGVLRKPEQCISCGKLAPVEVRTIHGPECVVCMRRRLDSKIETVIQALERVRIEMSRVKPLNLRQSCSAFSSTTLAS
jgi:hypothetical protein